MVYCLPHQLQHTSYTKHQVRATSVQNRIHWHTTHNTCPLRLLFLTGNNFMAQRLLHSPL
ncbi:hypothetical protein BDP55DRAFT_386070 [Colletotrichum godetiae]|uniref:Uncharacterized protein n=1 Tax=Colletotrichum godetiae TaxID=1209918 RepID=A0AAJ0EWJ9_9PEZI|nr:uncharacterized protein BDP55DRAFT_386070 [Colletotrichum godetiae]KAK1689994.1 hypothetical protein BDP55DRAFT_386070 [Colletotrichum godetiae]